MLIRSVKVLLEYRADSNSSISMEGTRTNLSSLAMDFPRFE